VKRAFLVERLLMLVALALLSLQLENCARKKANTESSATTIPDSLRRYPFRSAVIELKYSGSASGKQMIYIDDYGVKETTVDSLSMKLMGMELPNAKMQIRKGDSLYQIDFVRGMATRGVSHLSAGDEKAMSSMGEEMAKGMGMKKDSAEETVAGQRCTVWSSEQLGTKSWLWNNITLKSESKIGDDRILLDAVSVRLDVPVPAGEFDAPGRIHYTTQEEIEGMLKSMDKKAGTESGTKRRTR